MFLSKIFKRNASKKKSPLAVGRITNETVAEHRERILAGGRRFKYPMQYARHRLVFNTIIIVVVTLVVTILIGWWQLFIVQNTSSFFYRVTRVLPIPVASIDGKQVRYGDYLMYYNSSSHYLKQNEQVDLNNKDSQRQADYIKRVSIDNAIADAYALKIAKDLSITISESDINTAIDNDRVTVNGKITQETYDASAMNILGWSVSEYRQDTRNKLTRREVSYAIDDMAHIKQSEVAKLLKEKKVDFKKIASAVNKDSSIKVTFGTSGLVSHANRDGGLSLVASKLKKGQISDAIKTTTGDGYYFIRLIDKNSNQVNYEYICVPLTVFDNRLESLKKAGKVNEYIKVPALDQ